MWLHMLVLVRESLLRHIFLKTQEKNKKKTQKTFLYKRNLKTFPLFTTIVDINNLNIYKDINNFKNIIIEKYFFEMLTKYLMGLETVDFFKSICF